MSASLAREPHESTRIAATALLLPLLAGTLFPFDQVLAGMVGAGQGAEALCAFLGLTRASLFEHVTRLGLPTPHARPLRKTGARGWSVDETRALIAWRMAGVHPEVIGVRLSNRSANAVRAKARRLGLKPPPRKALHKPDPASLRIPAPGHAVGRTQVTLFTPADLCGRAAGPVSAYAGSTNARVVPPVRPTVVPRSVSPAARNAGSAEAQRELQLFWTVRTPPDRGGAPETSVPDARPSPPFPAAGPEKPETRRNTKRKTVRHEEIVRSATDLTWIGRLRNLTRDKEAVMLASLRYFGRQSYKYAAKQLGMSVAKLRTLYDRIDLPRDYDRKKFGAQYDEKRAYENVERCGYELVLCHATRRYWWRHKRDERFQRYSNEGARLRGMPRERYEPRRMCV